MYKSIILLLSTLVLTVNACSKEEYAAKFGAMYELHGIGAMVTPPFVKNNKIVAEVTYETTCANGGSTFTTTNMDKGQPGNVAFIIMSRNEPECGKKLEKPITFSGQVKVSLPTNIPEGNDKQWFLAFPPDGDYELYLLNPYKKPEPKKQTFEVKASPSTFEPAAVVTENEEEEKEVEERVLLEEEEITPTIMNETEEEEEMKDVLEETTSSTMTQLFAGLAEKFVSAFSL